MASRKLPLETLDQYFAQEDKIIAEVKVQAETVLGNKIASLIQRPEKFGIALLTGEEEYLPKSFGDHVELNAVKIEETKQEHTEIHIEQFNLILAPLSTTQKSRKESERLRRKEFDMFIRYYPGLNNPKEARYMILTVENREDLFSTLENFIKENTKYLLKHIILNGHGNQYGAYIIESASGETTLVPLVDIVKEIERYNATHRVGDYKTCIRLVFDMCYGHLHKGTKDSDIQVYCFTDEDDPVLYSWNQLGCEGLALYAQMARRAKNLPILTSKDWTSFNVDVEPMDLA